MHRFFLPVACAFVVLGAAPALPDGAHDFDFNFGSWHTHIRRLLHPLRGSNVWVTYDGTVTVRKVWGGAASVEEIEANGPDHLEFVNVRLYNKASHQWSLNGTSSSDGALATPTFGGFEDGRGVFYDQETFNGRTILDRQTFLRITPTSYAFEQRFRMTGVRRGSRTSLRTSRARASPLLRKARDTLRVRRMISTSTMAPGRRTSHPTNSPATTPAFRRRMWGP